MGVDRRAVIGLSIGVLGLALGAAAVAWDTIALAVLAGALALAGGVAVFRLVGHPVAIPRPSEAATNGSDRSARPGATVRGRWPHQRHGSTHAHRT